MSIALITGAGGLVGAQAARHFHEKGFEVVGIDNDMRRQFFGADASTRPAWHALERTLHRYRHHEVDIRDAAAIARLFDRHGRDVAVVIHAAAQPSHDWAAREPATDFTINANGTLVLLEAVRQHCPDAVFILCSTNKVYGDTPNRLPFEERATRWELPASHPLAAHGIDETMSIDGSMHSLFGVSKCAADLLVQEYGRYFGLRTACFRGGCLTGAGHAGAALHGFLSYLVRCAVAGQPYTVLGYKGKQVRDNIDARDLVEAFWHFVGAPRIAAVYNIGGGRHANCSVLEAIALAEEVTGRPMRWSYSDKPREGDHIWWISDTRRFQRDYPSWRPAHDLRAMVEAICAALLEQTHLPPM
ncbi:MAG: NAD-dependent epimerase/dehydratase family protein [Alphaproteobacteria bacterium]|nr:NAD-dependent epimerase/dehydratase family protein [Alphaproteobacteria bacterium]